MTTKILCFLALTSFMLRSPAFAGELPARPKIFGVAHYSTFVGNLAKARSFYVDFLGYEEVVALPKPDGTPRVVLLKINDRQFVELVNEPNRGEGLLNNFALATDNTEQMRLYLAARGVTRAVFHARTPTSGFA